MKKKHENPWFYLVITFSLTWLFMLPAAIIDKNINDTTVIILIILSVIFGRLIFSIKYNYCGCMGTTDLFRYLFDINLCG